MRRILAALTILLACATFTTAAVLEEGKSGSERTVTPMPPRWRPDPCGARAALREMVDGVRVGQVVRRRGVVIVPIMPGSWTGRENILSLDGALFSGRNKPASLRGLGGRTPCAPTRTRARYRNRNPCRMACAPVRAGRRGNSRIARLAACWWMGNS